MLCVLRIVSVSLIASSLTLGVYSWCESSFMEQERRDHKHRKWSITDFGSLSSPNVGCDSLVYVTGTCY